MNIPGYTTSGLLMMHGGTKNALTIDDNTLPEVAKPYGVRQYPDWREQADAIEAELDSRSVSYQKIVW